MSTICLDFDGVIHDPTNREPGYRMGKPIPGALDAVKYLLKRGHKLVVHTSRARSYEQIKHVQEWLRFFGFPPLEVDLEKPVADVYVDDRGFRFDAWEFDLRVLLRLVGDGAA